VYAEVKKMFLTSYVT